MFSNKCKRYKNSNENKNAIFNCVCCKCFRVRGEILYLKNLIDKSFIDYEEKYRSFTCKLIVGANHRSINHQY